MFLKNMNNPTLGVNLDSRPSGPSPSIITETFHVTDSAASDWASSAQPQSTASVISQLRKEFLEGTSVAEQSSVTKKDPPKTNKYLRPENRWTKPPLPNNAAGATPADNVNENMSDVVQGYVVQPAQMHKAEVVHVRQDSTSTEESADITLKEQSFAENNGQDARFEDAAFNNYIAESNDFIAHQKNANGLTKTKKGFFSNIFKKPPSNKSSKKSPKKKDFYEAEEENTSEVEVDNNESFMMPDEPNASMVAHASSSILECNNENVNPLMSSERKLNPLLDNDEDIFPPFQPLKVTRKRSMSKPTDLDELLRLQEEEEQMMSSKIDMEMANEMPKKTFNAEDVFANDPFFRDAMAEFEGKPPVPDRVPVARNVPIFKEVPTNDPIYENSYHNLYTHHPPSLNTTQEIDIDVALGYADEQAIENIEWPTADLPTNESIIPPKEVELDYGPPQPTKVKKSIFSFGKKNKKKPGKNDEVSYYVEEPQPEPRTPDNLDQDFQEEATAIIHEPQKSESKTPPTPSNKPSFFKFKSKKKGSPGNQSIGKEPFATNDELDQSNDIPEDLGLVQPEENNTADTETVNQSLPKDSFADKEPSPPSPISQLGPIREEKPSFFSFQKTTKKTPPRQTQSFEEKHLEVQVQQQQQPPPRSQSSRDSSPKRNKAKSRDSSPQRSKPSGKGLSGFFRSSSSNKKSNSSRKESSQIGTMAPVDVSHLVDEEEYDVAEDQDSAMQYSKPQIHDDSASKVPQQSISEMVQNEQTSSTKENVVQGPRDQNDVQQENGENIIATLQKDEITQNEPVEEEALPSVPQTRSTGSLPMRGRPKEKKKGSGFMSGFFSTKPPSRPPSQTRQRTPEPDQRPPFVRDRRSKSMPRHGKSSGGLTDFFNARPPSSSAANQNAPREQDSVQVTAESVEQPQVQKQLPPSQPSRRPPPKSKSTGGISNFFNMTPKHPRRPTGPPPSPPPSAAQETSEQPSDDQSQGQNRRLSAANSVSSISSQRRRESKGFANFLGSSPLRKSSRGPPSMPRSQTIDLATASRPPNARHESAMAPREPERPRQNPDFDKIEPASSENEHIPQASNPTSIPPANQSGRVMGRRSGRFRKSQDNSTPSQLKGPHVLPPPPATNNTEHAMMRDIFAEAVNRPSRRGSMSSLNQPSKGANDVLPDDSEYAQAISANYAQDQSNSKVGRTDSYKQAKTSSVTDESGRQMRNYNSLPRLGKGGRQQQRVGRGGDPGGRQEADDPETRSLGAGGRHPRQRGKRGDDNCQMM